MEDAILNDHSVLSEMLNISFEIDEIIDEYKLNLPTLNGLTLGLFEEKISKFPSLTGPVKKISDQVDRYKHLKGMIRRRAR